MLLQMYLINTEQREHLKLLRENSSDGIFQFHLINFSYYVLAFIIKHYQEK